MYRTFTRTWWADARKTIAKAGHKNYRASTRHATEESAQAECLQYNLDRFGPSKRGPRGLCMEFESF